MRPPSRLSTVLSHIRPSTTAATHPRPTNRKMSTCPSAPAIIAGVGPGTGASVARKFAQQYPVILMARNPDNYAPIVEEIEKQGGWARGISVDVSYAGSVERGFEEVGRLLGGGKEGDKGGKVAAAVFNVGGRFIRKPFLELTQEEFEAGWDANGCVIPYLIYFSFPASILCPFPPPLLASPFQFPLCPPSPPVRELQVKKDHTNPNHPPSRGAYLFTRATLPLLLSSSSSTTTYPPTLIFTSATAALKGSAQCASFATGKFALRALAQSLAREFGPRGVHVAHAVIDGVIDIPRTKEWKVEGGVDAKISADAVSLSFSTLSSPFLGSWGPSALGFRLDLGTGGREGRREMWKWMWDRHWTEKRESNPTVATERMMIRRSELTSNI